MWRYLLILVALASGGDAQAAPHKDRPPLLADPAISVGGGVLGFITPALRDVASEGALGTLRISAGNRKGVRLELAYLGTLEPLAARQGTVLVGNGVRAGLRVNIAPWVEIAEPFIYAGAGWTHLHVRGRPSDAMVHASDELLVIPIGLGVARSFGAWIVGVRGGVEITSGGDLLPVPPDPSTSRDAAAMHHYQLMASVGRTL